MTTMPEDRHGSDNDLRVLLASASLDAPRVDLWGRLEQPVLGLNRRRRPVVRGLRAVAAMLALLLGAGAMLAVFSLAGDDAPPVAGELASVPDLLLLQSWDQSGQSATLEVYLPQAQEIRTVLEGVSLNERPTISPDGRQIVYSGWELDGEEIHSYIWSFDSATFAPQWTARVASEPANSFDYPTTSLATVTTRDAVYVAMHRWDTNEPVTIAAYDRAGGAQTGSWLIDLGGRLGGGPGLYLHPDGGELYLTTVVYDKPQSSGEDVRTAFFRFRLPDMAATQRLLPIASETTPQPAWWNTQITPDGKTLYGFEYDGSGRLGVVFFDLATGAFLPAIDLPFDSDGYDWLSEHAVSHDGTRLYIFMPSSGELAIIDLEQRQVEQTVTVDMSRVQTGHTSVLGRLWSAARGLVVQDVSAKVYIQGNMQLSPDGSTLYAVGLSGNAVEGRPSGVLVINTATWQVTDHWLPETAPTQVLLSGDGRFLYARTGGWDSDHALIMIDTATGAEVFRTDATSWGATWSPAELYRGTYGRSPEVAGVAARGLSTGTSDQQPFARMSVSVSASTVVSGDSVTVDLRYLDPRTGEPVQDGDDSLVFERPDSVHATLKRGTQTEDTVTIVLTEAEHGHYRGAAQLTTPGAWSVKVIAQRANEPARSAGIADAVVVQAALGGSDGERYLLRVETDPAQPAAEQATTIRVAIVDAATGAPLPAGVTLQNGLPETMNASFFLDQAGVTSARLTPASHGTYTGSASFFRPGVWTVQVNFPNDGVRSGSIQAGVVEVR
jgi:Tol biopolymer transport system component/nitrogen fixation protein FixH